MAITVWEDGARHLPVLFAICEKCTHPLTDTLPIGAHELSDASFERLRTLCDRSHDEHWLTQSRRLLLQTTRVGQDDIRRSQAGNELRVLQRRHKLHVDQAFEHCADSLLYGGIGMHRKDKSHRVSKLDGEIAHCTSDVRERLAQFSRR